MSSKYYKANGCKHNLDLLMIFASIMCFLSHKKWVSLEESLSIPTGHCNLAIFMHFPSMSRNGQVATAGWYEQVFFQCVDRKIFAITHDYLNINKWQMVEGYIKLRGTLGTFMINDFLWSQLTVLSHDQEKSTSFSKNLGHRTQCKYDIELGVIV